MTDEKESKLAPPEAKPNKPATGREIHVRMVGEQKKSPWWETMNSSFVIFLLSSVVLGLISFAYKKWDDAKTAASTTQTEQRKLSHEMSRRLRAVELALAEIRECQDELSKEAEKLHQDKTAGQFKRPQVQATVMRLYQSMGKTAAIISNGGVYLPPVYRGSPDLGNTHIILYNDNEAHVRLSDPGMDIVPLYPDLASETLSTLYEGYLRTLETDQTDSTIEADCRKLFDLSREIVSDGPKTDLQRAWWPMRHVGKNVPEQTYDFQVELDLADAWIANVDRLFVRIKSKVSAVQK